MDKHLKMQLDVKNNAEDLRNYALELSNWEKDMKRKELNLINEKPIDNNIPPPRNKIKRSKPENEKNSNKPKKISAYDYSAWDKFDVEKACAEIDEEGDDEKNLSHEFEDKKTPVNKEEDSNASDPPEKNFSLIDEAFYEKEMGNNFVKKEQWNDAIKCYTNAINLEPRNAVFYANRSLCFLKLKNFKAAETDATTAIQLDKNYVKAYQRRAFARATLGQLVEAKSDYEEILKLEPKNALSRLEINKIDDKLKKEQKLIKPAEKKLFNPQNMFKSEENKVEIKQISDSSKVKGVNMPKDKSNISKIVPSQNKTVTPKENNTLDISKPSTQKRNDMDCTKNFNLENEGSNFIGGDGDKAVPSQSSKLEVFQPLPDWCKIIYPINIPPHKRSKKPLKRINIELTDKDEDINIVREIKSECSNVCEKKEEEEIIKRTNEEKEVMKEGLSFDVPKTAIQFQKCWKILKKNPEEAYLYLQKIPGRELPRIFENSLESDFFSELVTFLASDEIEKDPDFVFDFFLGLSTVKRFSFLILFMSESDKECVKKCLTKLENVKTKKEISQLLRLYELNV